jgi:hypothetical protein
MRGFGRSLATVASFVPSGLCLARHARPNRPPDYLASVILPPENAPEQEFVPEYVPVILVPLPSIWSAH